MGNVIQETSPGQCRRLECSVTPSTSRGVMCCSRCLPLTASVARQRSRIFPCLRSLLVSVRTPVPDALTLVLSWCQSAHGHSYDDHVQRTLFSYFLSLSLTSLLHLSPSLSIFLSYILFSFSLSSIPILGLPLHSSPFLDPLLPLSCPSVLIHVPHHTMFFFSSGFIRQENTYYCLYVPPHKQGRTLCCCQRSRDFFFLLV